MLPPASNTPNFWSYRKCFRLASQHKINSNVLNDKPLLQSDHVSLNFKANTLSQLNP